MKRDRQKEKLDLINQSRERTPIPRPAVFRDRKKYDRNAAKDEERKERNGADD